MTNILEALTTLYPDQIWLEVSPEQLEQTWPSAQEYSYDVARWTAFKNRLTLDAFLAWFKVESGIEEQPEVWPGRNALASIWEVVNGTVIQLGETRIGLIPHEGMDINEYEVPAEWVDIPSWAADYYLAVQVNPDDCWLRVWGYATHKKLKQVGQYDSIRRTYALKQEELIEDLNLMWVARELGCDRKAAVKPLPTLSPAQAERLLEQLSQRTPYSPRLEVPFERWAALLASDEWRQELYDRRLGRLAPVAAPREVRVNLSQWFQNVCEAGWQSIEALLSTEPANPALSLRNAPEADVERGKLIDLGIQQTGQAVVLIVSLTPENSQEMDIMVEVYPTSGKTYLPPNLQLMVLDKEGATVMEAQARSANKNIQFQFSSEPGERFSVKVALGDVSVIDNFVI